jgi:hypothetical protein
MKLSAGKFWTTERLFLKKTKEKHQTGEAYISSVQMIFLVLSVFLLHFKFYLYDVAVHFLDILHRIMRLFVKFSKA